MAATSIQWTDLSFNPIRAKRSDDGQRVYGHFCQKISAGCANCYASAFQPRFHMPTFTGVNKSPVDSGVEVFLDEKLLKSLLKRRKPAKVFWCDMSDLFGDWVPFEWIDKCFAVMALTPHLTHQILTKRPERMEEYLNDYRCMLGFKTHENIWKLSACMDHKKVEEAYKLRINDVGTWPLPNVWLGTSCENRKAADERIPHLMRCPAAVRFLSVEPLLGPVDLGDDFWESVNRVDWVIVGCESGSKAREMKTEWAQSILDQCSAAGVPFFMKQMMVGGKLCGETHEFPEPLRVRQMPVRA